MMDKRERLTAIFCDTQQLYTTDPELVAAIDASRKNTKLFDAGKVPAFPDAVSRAGTITVTKSRTYEAAMRLANRHPGKKIAVLNFASATKPGGGVINGSSAQAESLCRCSTLYPPLDRRFLWQNYYDVNCAAGDVLHTDACIYTPDIVICKTDENFPERMPKEKWVTVDVISCAAPNLRNTPANLYNPESGQAVSILPADLQRLHEQRARTILAVAARADFDAKRKIKRQPGIGCIFRWMGAKRAK